jgi:ribosomal-protein-alanine N-acetyltransferase
VQFETERLILRDFAGDDWPAVLAYQSDPRYLRVYGLAGRSDEEVQEFVRQFLVQQGARPRYKYQLAVTLKDGGRLIGNCGLRKEAPNSQVANIGYELSPDYWGHGYASEAIGRLVAFGFERLGLRRVWARTTSDNRASVRVLEKLGLRLEGRMRSHERIAGKWVDRLIYGMLADEWFAARPPSASDRKHIV